MASLLPHLILVTVANIEQYLISLQFLSKLLFLLTELYQHWAIPENIHTPRMDDTELGT